MQMENIQQIEFDIINPNQTELDAQIGHIGHIKHIKHIEHIEHHENQTNIEDNSINSSNGINYGSDPDLVYNLILDEIFDIITDNKNLFSKQNHSISKPDIIFENKKTIWTNFKKNCEQINRTTYQVQKYITKELTAETSINEKGHLIIRGRYDPMNLIKQFKSYIKNFVECSACKSFHTEIYRNSSNRMDYLKCLNEKPKCNYSKVVAKI